MRHRLERGLDGQCIHKLPGSDASYVPNLDFSVYVSAGVIHYAQPEKARLRRAEGSLSLTTRLADYLLSPFVMHQVYRELDLGICQEAPGVMPGLVGLIKLPPWITQVSPCMCCIH